MAYTKQQIEAAKNTQLASGQPDKITATKHRQFVQLIIDELYDPQSRANLMAALDVVLSTMASDKAVIIRNGVAKLIDISLLGGEGGGDIEARLSTAEDTLYDLGIDHDEVTVIVTNHEGRIVALEAASALFLGLYTSLANLETAHATAEPGQYAIVDPGSGTDAVKYIWDEDEGWVAGGGGGTADFASITGNATDNASLAAALNAKSDSTYTYRSVTGNHTLDATDLANIANGKVYILQGNSAGDLTVPLNSTVAFPNNIGFGFRGFNNVVATGGVTITPDSGSMATNPGQTSSFEKPGTNAWTLHNGSPDTKLDKANTAVALTDASSIDLTATKHTLASSSATRTFTISYTGDDITMQVTLSNTAATYTFPAAALCVSEGIASGNNILALSGVSGDKYIITVKKIGSAYFVVCKNFGQ